MITTVMPGSIQGVITAPPSKSAMQRACALALLNNGHTIIQNPGTSDDDEAALRIIKDCGAQVRKSADGSLMISSDGRLECKNILNCGESGLSIRMFAVIAALAEKEITLTGTGTLLQRPMDYLDQLYKKLQVQFVLTHNSFPLKVKGPLKAVNIHIDAADSSQYLTGLLFAYAKAAKDIVTITADNLVSKPYIDLSIELLNKFGYKAENDRYRTFKIYPVADIHRNIVYEVEGDWSNAAFLLVAGAVGKPVEVKGLQTSSMQPDKNILDILQQAGGEINVTHNSICVSPGVLTCFNYDATDSPDLFPSLAVLAANCKGVSRISGINRLFAKESNRLTSLTNLLMKVGIQVSTEGDDMVITGGNIEGGSVDSYNDHRIVMAAAIAAINSSGMIQITGSEAVSKSYPAFFNDLVRLGADVSLSE